MAANVRMKPVCVHLKEKWGDKTPNLMQYLSDASNG